MIDGIKLVINVGVMLLVFMVFVVMFNYILLNGVGSWIGLNDYVVENIDGCFIGFNLEYLFGLIFVLIVWLLGLSSVDIMIVG